MGRVVVFRLATFPVNAQVIYLFPNYFPLDVLGLRGWRRSVGGARSALQLRRRRRWQPVFKLIPSDEMDSPGRVIPVKRPEKPRRLRRASSLLCLVYANEPSPADRFAWSKGIRGASRRSRFAPVISVIFLNSSPDRRGSIGHKFGRAITWISNRVTNSGSRYRAQMRHD